MANTQKIIPKRGEIFLVDFDPSVGSEIQKIRPALILQNDIANKYSLLTIVAAISTYQEGENLYPVEVHVTKNNTGLIKDSIIVLNQVRTIDKRRLIKKLGSVENATMNKVDIALQLSLGIIKV
jgi:mRNA interferase MazF